MARNFRHDEKSAARKKVGPIGRVGQRISGNRRSWVRVSAGSTCMSLLMMFRAWPMSKCCRMKAA
jgi:hypothetical protein